MRTLRKPQLAAAAAYVAAASCAVPHVAKVMRLSDARDELRQVRAFRAADPRQRFGLYAHAVALPLPALGPSVVRAAGGWEQIRACQAQNESVGSALAQLGAARAAAAADATQRPPLDAATAPAALPPPLEEERDHDHLVQLLVPRADADLDTALADLREHLRAAPTRSQRAALRQRALRAHLRAFRALLRAACVFHARGVAHLDLQPRNVVVTFRAPLRTGTRGTASGPSLSGGEADGGAALSLEALRHTRDMTYRVIDFGLAQTRAALATAPRGTTTTCDPTCLSAAYYAYPLLTNVYFVHVKDDKGDENDGSAAFAFPRGPRDASAAECARLSRRRAASLNEEREWMPRYEDAACVEADDERFRRTYRVGTARSKRRGALAWALARATDVFSSACVLLAVLHAACGVQYTEVADDEQQSAADACFVPAERSAQVSVNAASVGPCDTDKDEDADDDEDADADALRIASEFTTVLWSMLHFDAAANDALVREFDAAMSRAFCLRARAPSNPASIRGRCKRARRSAADCEVVFEDVNCFPKNANTFCAN